MESFAGKSKFGHAAKCNSLKELIDFLQDVSGEAATNATVAYGMIVAAHATKPGKYRADALAVLDALAHAKAKLDSTMCHAFPTVKVTGDILFSAQLYAYQNTFPCTEWPMPEDIIDKVIEVAEKYANADKWTRVIRNERGAIIGVENL
ncbi:MAG: hypothetical protein ACPG8W_16655 [Candidatus Promineifilaceae bacterium]